jgi:hypothetical protein
MRLCLGSGASGYEALRVITSDFSDWKLVDVCPEWSPTECYDVSAGIREADESVDEVYMGDFFEHIPAPRGPFVLKECRRVLKRGALLRVAVPDMAKVMPHWLESPSPDLACLVWGQQGATFGTDPFPDTHYQGFTEDSLTKTLTGAGFCDVARTSIHGVWYELAMRATKGAT